jgi:hypothetical protein
MSISKIQTEPYLWTILSGRSRLSTRHHLRACSHTYIALLRHRHRETETPPSLKATYDYAISLAKYQSWRIVTALLVVLAQLHGSLFVCATTDACQRVSEDASLLKVKPKPVARPLARSSSSILGTSHLDRMNVATSRCVH